jgi:hypothetical protein
VRVEWVQDKRPGKGQGAGVTRHWPLDDPIASPHVPRVKGRTRRCRYLQLLRERAASTWHEKWGVSLYFRLMYTPRSEGKSPSPCSESSAELARRRQTSLRPRWRGTKHRLRIGFARTGEGAGVCIECLGELGIGGIAGKVVRRRISSGSRLLPLLWEERIRLRGVCVWTCVFLTIS